MNPHVPPPHPSAPGPGMGPDPAYGAPAYQPPAYQASGYQASGYQAPAGQAVPPSMPAAGDGAPAAAGPGRRAAAWAIDFALVLLVAWALGSFTWTRITGLITDVPGLAERGVWYVVTSGGDVKGASASFGLSLWRSATSYVVQAFVILVVVVLLYHFIGLAWKGRTVGKLALDLRVEAEPPAKLGKGKALLRATATTMSDVGLFALACCLLVKGFVLVSVLVWLLAVAVFWGNALPAALQARRTMQDRVLGTRVARANLYSAAVGHAVQGGQVALQSAQKGLQSAREGAQRLAENEKVQGLRNAASAQRVQDLGRGAAGKAAETGRSFLGKAKQVYAERRDAAAQQTPQQPQQYPSPHVPQQAPPPAIEAPQPPLPPFGQQNPYGQPQAQPQAQPNYRVPPPEEQ